MPLHAPPSSWKTLLTLAWLFLLSPELPAQVTGGRHVFQFLNLPASARLTALGGHLITVRDDDLTLAWSNPASLSELVNGQISVNHHFYLADINAGYAAYGHHLPRWKTTLHGGLSYLSYGKFDATDPTGQITGSFQAGEYAMAIGAGRQLYERLSIGANLKLVSSQFESYQSLGLSTDLAAMFHDTARQLNIALVLRNMGTQLSYYRPDNREALPLEMQVGLSKRLKYLPFRFSVIYRYLDRWNITYDDPNSEEDIFNFEINTGNTSLLDNFARHLVLSGEFLFGKKENFRLRIGYNHLQRREMELLNLRSLAGFSTGIGMKINRFRFEFGHAFSHLGAGTNHVSLLFKLKKS
ncbi:MAG: hypothetical protein RI973_2298 [Bacteroidota bacterium]|jgi:hypothetical protein